MVLLNKSYCVLNAEVIKDYNNSKIKQVKSGAHKTNYIRTLCVVVALTLS